MISIPEKLSGALSLHPGPVFRSGKYGKHVTFLHSRKNRGLVACETLLEADFCLELERLHLITAYQAQPLTIVVTQDQKRYTPDFAARLIDGRVILYEIKPDARMKDTSTRNKLRYFQNLFSECGYVLECIPESQFGHPIRTHNLQILYQQSFGETVESAASVCRLIRSSPNGKLTIQELLASGARSPSIAFVLFYGQAKTDLDHPLGLQTQLICRKDHGQQSEN